MCLFEAPPFPLAFYWDAKRLGVRGPLKTDIPIFGEPRDTFWQELYQCANWASLETNLKQPPTQTSGRSAFRRTARHLSGGKGAHLSVLFGPFVKFVWVICPFEVSLVRNRLGLHADLQAVRSGVDG